MTKYPPSTWLFERLESGKFNMKLADGEHTFAELPAVMQDIAVAVKTNNATTYILTITTAGGEFDTPNLRGNDAPLPSIDPGTKHWKIGEEDTGIVAEGKDGKACDDTEIKNALSALQQQVNTLVSGDASSAIESFNEIIAFLANVEDSQTLAGIIAGLNQSIADVQAAIPTKISQLQNDDHTVKDESYVHTDNNYSNDEKTKVSDSLRLKEYADVESLEALPSSPYNLRFVYTTATPQAINFADFDSVPEMQEFYASVLNSSGTDFDQPLPNAELWQSNETSVSLPNGKLVGISLKKEHGIMVIRV
ncbi:MAG: hypothetical protein LUH63_07190 [Parabacteroides sp.]|nr:hypothetical protein [Parabacteroides sp.]